MSTFIFLNKIEINTHPPEKLHYGATGAIITSKISARRTKKAMNSFSLESSAPIKQETPKLLLRQLPKMFDLLIPHLHE